MVWIQQHSHLAFRDQKNLTRPRSMRYIHECWCVWERQSVWSGVTTFFSLRLSYEWIHFHGLWRHQPARFDSGWFSRHGRPLSAGPVEIACWRRSTKRHQQQYCCLYTMYLSVADSIKHLVMTVWVTNNHGHILSVKKLNHFTTNLIQETWLAS